MLEDAKNGVINCIIVKDQSRFGRNHIDVETLIIKTFREYNIRFIAILDNYDTLTSGYDMMFSIRNLFNEHYAQDISQKCQAAFKAKQRNGEFIGAFACYGYKKSEKDKHKLEIDPYAAEVVRRIFDMYIAGYGKVRIAKILNEEVDYIGTRLHAGIFAMQHKVRSFILEVDNRSQDMAETFGINCIMREDFKNLEKMINQKHVTDVNIHEKEILQWKKQFLEL